MPLNQFKTDKAIEENGAIVEIDEDNRVTIFRASLRRNAKYAESFRKHSEKFADKMESGKLTPDEDNSITAKVYAESIVKSWECKRGDEWVDGISYDADSEPVEATPENVEQAMLSSDFVFGKILNEANSYSRFREKQIKDDVKN